MLKTKGKHFIEENTGREFIPWGAWIWGSDFRSSTRYVTHVIPALDNMVAKGFNTTGIYLGWSNIESIAGSGVYDNTLLNRIDDMIQQCQARDLYFGLCIRIGATGWHNQAVGHFEPWMWHDRFYEPYEDYIKTGNWVDKAPGAPAPHDPNHSWRFYWDSFLDLWRMLGARYDVYDNVFFVPYFYPWHGREPIDGTYGPNQEKYDWWEQTLTPELYGSNGALREVTDKMLVWTPAGQGSQRTNEASALYHDPRNVVAPPTNQKILKNDPYSNTGRYEYVNPSVIGLLNNNIVFGTNGHKPHSIEKGYSEPQKWYWNTDLEREMNHEMWRYGHDFMNQYDVPMMVHEMGYFTRHNPLNAPPPQWVLDGYRVKHEEIARGNPMSIVYWVYDTSNYESILTTRNGSDLDGIGLLLQEFQPDDIENGNGGEEMVKVTNASSVEITVYKTKVVLTEEPIVIAPGQTVPITVADDETLVWK